jgi:hypothetical protein
MSTLISVGQAAVKIDKMGKKRYYYSKQEKI